MPASGFQSPSALLVHIDLDGDLLRLPVSGVAQALGLVEISEQGVPGLGIARLARQILESRGHHRIDDLGIGVLVVPPIAGRAVPTGGIGIMDPHDPAGMNPLGDAHGAVGRLAGRKGRRSRVGRGGADRAPDDRHGGDRAKCGQHVPGPVQQELGSATGYCRTNQADDPHDKRARQRSGHPLARVRRPTRFGDDPEQEPDESEETRDGQQQGGPVSLKNLELLAGFGAGLDYYPLHRVPFQNRRVAATPGRFALTLYRRSQRLSNCTEPARPVA